MNPQNLYCEVLGTTPNLVNNLSWYKDMSYSYAKQIQKDFLKMRHILISTEFEMSFRNEVQNECLLGHFVRFRSLIMEYMRDMSETRCKAQIAEILKILNLIVQENEDLGEMFSQSIKECIALLEDLENLNAEKIASMPTFSHAWGKGQQYVSFLKKIRRSV